MGARSRERPAGRRMCIREVVRNHARSIGGHSNPGCQRNIEIPFGAFPFMRYAGSYIDTGAPARARTA